MHKLCMACLLSFVEQTSWVELARQRGLSDQKIKKGTFVRVDKLSIWQSPIKIHDVVGTPNGTPWVDLHCAPMFVCKVHIPIRYVLLPAASKWLESFLQTEVPQIRFLGLQVCTSLILIPPFLRSITHVYFYTHGYPRNSLHPAFLKKLRQPYLKS